MKIIRTLVALIVIGLTLWGAAKVITMMSESDLINAEDYTFSYRVDADDTERIVLTVDTECSKAKVKINGKAINAVKVDCQDGKTSIGIWANVIEYNQLLDFAVSFHDESGKTLEKGEIKDVCFTKDGKIAEHDIQTLIMYNYFGAEFPQINDKKLRSLFIINSEKGENNITLEDINHITSLESLYIDAKGKVTGPTKSLKALREIRRLVIIDAPKVEGEIDSIDGLDLMEVLILEKTSIEGDLKDIAPLNKIKQLRLSDNKNLDGDIQWLKKLTKLESAELISCKFTGDIGELEGMENLAKLYIDKCKGLSGSLTLFNGEEVELE